MFKQELEILGLGKEAKKIEDEAKLEMEKLWQSRLPKP